MNAELQLYDTGPNYRSMPFVCILSSALGGLAIFGAFTTLSKHENYGAALIAFLFGPTMLSIWFWRVKIAYHVQSHTIIIRTFPWKAKQITTADADAILVEWSPRAGITGRNGVDVSLRRKTGKPCLLVLLRSEQQEWSRVIEALSKAT